MKKLTKAQRMVIYWNAANILREYDCWDSVSNCCWALSKAMGYEGRIHGIDKWFEEFELFHPNEVPEGHQWFDDLQSRQTCMLLCAEMCNDK